MDASFDYLLNGFLLTTTWQQNVTEPREKQLIVMLMVEPGAERKSAVQAWGNEENSHLVSLGFLTPYVFVSSFESFTVVEQAYGIW